MCLFNDQYKASRTSGQVIVRRGKDFNITIFLDTINVINVKLCMVVLHTELYLFIPLLVTLTIFQGHSSVEIFN